VSVLAAILFEGGKTLLKVTVTLVDEVNAAKLEIVIVFPTKVQDIAESSDINSRFSTTHVFYVGSQFLSIIKTILPVPGIPNSVVKVTTIS
jgi:hypothetical protein